MTEYESAIKYFERKLRNFEKSLIAADKRGDEGAVIGLRKKMEHYREALKALKGVEHGTENI